VILIQYDNAVGLLKGYLKIARIAGLTPNRGILFLRVLCNWLRGICGVIVKTLRPLYPRSK
jgi:hypothetical protein